MAGQIIPKGERKFLVRVFIGRDGVGKRQYRSELVNGGKRDADKRLTELLKEKNEGVLIARPKVRLTVEAYLDDWLENVVKPSRRIRTLADYTRVVDSYIKPHLGKAVLPRLSPMEIRAMLVKLSAQGLAPRTVRMVHEVIRNALAQAVRDRLIRDNPARSEAVKPALPPKDEKEPVTLPADAVHAFLDVAEDDRLHALWVLLLMAGLRPSEALALRWSDVRDSMVSITRTLVDDRTTGPLHFAPPKSKKSRRAVVVPDVVTDALKKHRVRQAVERLAAGDKWEDGDLIFCTELGRPIQQDHIRHHFKKLVKAGGLPPGLTVYGLRHSCATLLLERGISLKAVSERLGHSSPQLTVSTYAHVTPSMQQQAADVLQGLAK